MPSPSSAPAPSRSFARWMFDMPAWKWAILVLAIGAMAAGAFLHQSTSAAGVAGTSASLLDGTTNDGGADTSPAAKGVFRLGFSFVAGFCLGSFVRAALRTAAIAFGFWLALTFVLAYFGLVTVDWNAIDSLWDRFTANVAAEWTDFRTFVTGSLPAAGLATTGIVVGLKRH